MDTGRKGAEQVSRGQDPDQAPVVGDERRAEVECAHLLGDLPERVLGRDDERLGRHHLCDGGATVAFLAGHRLQPERGQFAHACGVEFDLDGDGAGSGGASGGLSTPAKAPRKGAR
jgi:hypothetical protein